jgi:hypothetical protein
MIPPSLCLFLRVQPKNAAKTCADPQTDPFFHGIFCQIQTTIYLREQLRAHTVDGFILLIHQLIRHGHHQFYTLTVVSILSSKVDLIMV